MTDDRDLPDDPEDETPPSDDPSAPPPRRASTRDPYRSLEAFSAIQRQLATLDFSALNAAQRTIEHATSFKISSILAAQDAVAKNFAQTIDFSRLMPTHKMLINTNAFAAVTAAQNQWAKSLARAIDFSALHDALASSAALASISGTLNALTESIKQQSDFLVKITQGFTFDLPKIDATEWIEALDRWIPLNLRDVDDLDGVADVALSDGLPLSWIPRAEIVVALISADSSEERHAILRDRTNDILDDCEAALVDNNHEWAQQCRNAIAAMRAMLDAPAQSHAGNIIDSIVFALHGKNGRDNAKQRAEEDFNELPLHLAAENLTLRPLFRAFTAWWPASGDTPPEHFARHATAHAVGYVGVFAPISALVAVMLATSLTIQYSPEHPMSSDDGFFAGQ